MRLLKNKIALVTGGGRGIGKAIVHQYLEEGATVIIAEFDENSEEKKDVSPSKTQVDDPYEMHQNPYFA